MAVINVSTDKLISAATEFQNTGNSIRTLTAQMTETVNGLTGAIGSGEAATKYISQFQGLQNDMERINAMINEHVTDLNAMAREYETSDKNAVSQASALQSDVIV